jgi:hypothetical protein
MALYNMIKRRTATVAMGALLFGAACGDKQLLPTIDTQHGRGYIVHARVNQTPDGHGGWDNVESDRYNIRIRSDWIGSNYITGFRLKDGTWIVHSEPDRCTDQKVLLPPCEPKVRAGIVGLLEEAKSIDDNVKR